MSENQKSSSKQEETVIKSNEFDFEKVKEAMQHNPEAFKQILSMLNIESSSDETDKENIEDEEVIEEFISENDLIGYNTGEDEEDETVEEQIQELQQALNNLTPQTKNKKRSKNKKPIYDMPIKEVVSEPVKKQDETLYKYETPVINKSIEEVPTTKAPIVDESIEKVSNVETPIVEKHIEEVPITDTPISEKPAEKVSNVETPIVEKHIEEVPITDTPISEKPAKKVSNVETSNSESKISKKENSSSGKSTKTTGNKSKNKAPKIITAKNTNVLTLDPVDEKAILDEIENNKKKNKSSLNQVIEDLIPKEVSKKLDEPLVDEVIEPICEAIEEIVVEKNPTDKPVEPASEPVIENDSNPFVEEILSRNIDKTSETKEIPLTGSFIPKNKPEDKKEKSTADLKVPLNGSFGIETPQNTNVEKNNINTTPVKPVIPKTNVPPYLASVMNKQSEKPAVEQSVIEKSVVEQPAIEKPVIEKPVDVIIDENNTEPIGGIFGLEDEKPLTGSFTLKEKIEDISQKDVNELDVPLGGSFGVEPAEVTTSGKFEANDNKKIVNSSPITDTVPNAPVNIPISDTQPTITKPIENTVKKQNSVDLTNVVIDENSTEPIGGVFGIEEEKPLTGSFTLKEKIEDISQKDVNELDVPLGGSFGVEPAEVTTSGKFEANDNKKIVNSSPIIDTVPDAPVNIPISDTQPTITKPIENTVKKQNSVDLTNVVIDENSTEPIGGVFGIEEEKPLTGSFTLKEKIEDISQKDVNELDVPLDGSFDVEPAEVTVSGKFEASDNKKSIQSTDISFKDGNTYDIDSIFSAILQTADNFKDKNVSAVEFAEKVKNILEKK